MLNSAPQRDGQYSRQINLASNAHRIQGQLFARWPIFIEIVPDVV